MGCTTSHQLESQDGIVNTVNTQNELATKHTLETSRTASDNSSSKATESGALSANQYQKLIGSSVELLTEIVRFQLNALEATPLESPISDEIIYTLGLSFGRASNTFKLVQPLMDETVTRLGNYALKLPASVEYNIKREQLILLSVAYWNNCMAKVTDAIPCLTPTQRGFLDLKTELMANEMTEDERIDDCAKTLELLIPSTKENDLVDAMVRLSVHYYKLHDLSSYKDIMLKSLQQSLSLPKELGSSLPFRLGFICLLIHTEWDTGKMPLETLNGLLTTSFLPDWMHTYMCFEPCPLPEPDMQDFKTKYDVKSLDVNTRNMFLVKWP